jgi:hypothetical protein
MGVSRNFLCNVCLVYDFSSTLFIIDNIIVLLINNLSLLELLSECQVPQKFNMVSESRL